MPDESNDINQHLNSLRTQHRDLDQELQQLIKHKYVDPLQVQALKRQKLKLKDKIAHLESNLIPK